MRKKRPEIIKTIYVYAYRIRNTGVGGNILALVRAALERYRKSVNHEIFPSRRCVKKRHTDRDHVSVNRMIVSLTPEPTGFSILNCSYISKVLHINEQCYAFFLGRLFGNIISPFEWGFPENTRYNFIKRRTRGG